MGAHFWVYFVPYEDDIGQALQHLRQREFAAGRYNPVVRFPEQGSLSSAPQHRSIEDAIAASEADGTRSILDMIRIGDRPDFGVVTRIPDAQLQECFGTLKPTRRMIERFGECSLDLERGHGVYAILYDN